jgi:co-chaperonin GroES (HSP10)
MSSVELQPAPASIEAILEIMRPTAYRLLVRLLKLGEQTKGGIYLPENARKAHEAASQMAVVLAMGAAAYREYERFPCGPYCQVGDTVLMREYSGTRFCIDGEEYRLINDDTVEAVIYQPERITRAV